MTRSRGPMPPPAPPPTGRRPGTEDPAWPPTQGRQAAPDPRYAAHEPADAGQYRYPDQQRGYEQPPARQPGPTLGQLAANMRSADSSNQYQEPPHNPRYGHQGVASYAAPPAARAQRAHVGNPPLQRGDDLRGAQYDDWQRQQADPASYDLGSYGRAGGRGQPGWQGGRGEDPDFEPYPQQRQDHRGAGRYQSEPGYDNHDQDYADDEPEDEPRRGGRRWLIVAALVGSIGLGGALAYVYKTYVADKAGARLALIKSPVDPQRKAPENPGGKQFANQDSKMLGKLDQDSGRGEVDANGVRRVPTVQVNRDGSLGSAPVPVLPPGNRPTVSVPGMTIVDGFSSGGGVAPPPPPRVEATAPATPRSNIPPLPGPPPSVKNVASPPAARSEARVAAGPPVAAETPVASKKAVPKTSDAATPGGTPKTGSGYVAVLTTLSTRMAALSAFADLQQKYPFLQDKVPDVIEADLTGRKLGTMYRLVVGPPGARPQAAAVCSQLKAAGYTDCWTTQY